MQYGIHIWNWPDLHMLQIAQQPTLSRSSRASPLMRSLCMTPALRSAEPSRALLIVLVADRTAADAGAGAAEPAL
eukprot:1161319-Pelagomonas_calceolata.AAC.8